MRVSVHIVTYQSWPDILEALRSLECQTFTDFRVVVVDNASNDETVKSISSEYGNRIAMLRNFQNLGFATAHNQAIELARRGKSEYVLVMNPDVILFPTTLDELVGCANRHGRIGAIAPRLLRPPGSSIDSTGTRCRRSFYVFDRGSGKPEVGNYLREEEVFGCSGALALYRLAALEDVRLGSEYFDTDFFSYKEDVDLSWRLRLRGFEIWYAPKAIALHTRRTRGSPEEGFLRMRASRIARSPAIICWSYRNHLWVLLKNLHWSLAFQHSPWLCTREILKALYLSIFEFTPWRLGLVQALKGLPRMLRKRQSIMSSASISSQQMRKWFE